MVSDNVAPAGASAEQRANHKSENFWGTHCHAIAHSLDKAMRLFEHSRERLNARSADNFIAPLRGRERSKRLKNGNNLRMAARQGERRLGNIRPNRGLVVTPTTHRTDSGGRDDK
jgi:hypothetical protein